MLPRFAVMMHRRRSRRLEARGGTGNYRYRAMLEGGHEARRGEQPYREQKRQERSAGRAGQRECGSHRRHRRPLAPKNSQVREFLMSEMGRMQTLADDPGRPIAFPFRRSANAISGFHVVATESECSTEPEPPSFPFGRSRRGQFLRRTIRRRPVQRNRGLFWR